MHDDDGEGKRLIRGKHRVKVAKTPTELLGLPGGAHAFVLVRVGAHFAGPGEGPFTDTLCQLCDLVSGNELYLCGDLYIKRSYLVGAYQLEE